MIRLLIVLCAALVIAYKGAPATAEETPNPLSEEGSWSEIKEDIVGGAFLANGENLFSIDAPYRANDAATVPIVIAQTDKNQMINALDLVVDENPSPLVAHLEFGAAMHPVKFETRVRIDLYSNVRAIAQTDAGQFMTGRFVKASGGCSAPASRDSEKAMAGLGQMRLRFFDNAPLASGVRREAQIMLRHPNYSGLQRNQVTQLFIPAHFIDTLKVMQGDEVLFTLTGGISISENPVFRFEYTDNGSDFLTVEATDTQGNVFQQRFAGRNT